MTTKSELTALLRAAREAILNPDAPREEIAEVLDRALVKAESDLFEEMVDDGEE